MFEVRVESSFEAGHRRGPGGEETGLHHHDWQVAARVRSEGLDHIGIVVDFRLLRAALDEVLAGLDQRVLEEVNGFAAEEAPTPPAVASWIFERLDTRLAAAGRDPGHDFRLEAVEVEADPGTRFEALRG